MQWEKKFLITTILLSLALIPLYFLGIYFENLGINPLFVLFDLDGENNIISWYSSILLFSSSICLFYISRAKRKKYEKIAWLSLSWLFLLLSLDEIASIHNMFGGLLSKLLIEPLFSVATKGYTWVIVGLPIVIILFFVWKRLLQDTMPTKAKYAALAGFLFFIIAMLGETMALYLFAEGTYGASVITTIEIIVEETFELFGMISFLYAFLLTLKKNKFKS